MKFTLMHIFRLPYINIIFSLTNNKTTLVKRSTAVLAVARIAEYEACDVTTPTFLSQVICLIIFSLTSAGLSAQPS